MKNAKVKIGVLLVAALAAATFLVSQNGRREQVGPLPGGGFLLNTGWKILPAGKQLEVDTMPMASAMAPDGRYMLVLNGGYKPPSISVIDTREMKETSRVPVADAWLGLTFSPKGDFVYVGGGSKATVFEFAYSNGTLVPARQFIVVEEAKRTVKDFIGDVAFTQDGHLIYAADLYHDRLVIINPQSGMLIGEVKTGRRPYRILFPKELKSYFVSSWADGSVSQYQTADNSPLQTIRLGAHTVDMVWKAGKPEGMGEGDPDTAGKDLLGRLFIAAANTNNVYNVGVTESGQLLRLETINLAMTPDQPLGMTPSALGLSTDGKRLFVACSDANAVATTDISQARTVVQGYIPTGWYPMAVRVLADHRIVILNGRGLGSHPNPEGPNPIKKAAPVHQGGKSEEYVLRIQPGTISFVNAPSDAALAAYTQTVIDNSPYKDSMMDEASIPQGNPVPAHPTDPSPIKHVIYIVQENRTYDQVLGDMKKGNGDASLVLFGENVTPNHHKIANEFVLFDNFYVSSDVSADGHNWATAAIAPDYTIKLSPNSYAGRRKGGYDYEGQEIANRPPAGYIWTNAHEAGISIRNYGYFANNRKTAGPNGEQIESSRDPILGPVTNANYRAFDLEYSDIERAKVFIQDLKKFEASGDMPKLLLMRMGNDHTFGAAAGKVSPQSLVADNDQGIGMVVEAVSKSKFWGETAIFIIEDDAQNGCDHVDSHRSPAYLISPFVKRGSVDSSMYNTTSVLRTIELIIGLQPMTMFDAASRPMFAAMQNVPDLKPFEAEKPRIPLDTRNPASTAAARRTAEMDFSEEDRIDDDELNSILWATIKGPNVPEPAPVRSRFAH
ncbi:MAG TPA: alkaline phosphatase family protein [Bryobacteraceae bacterium]|jgi:DNA-binding beta-propeller fold protein YncE